MSVGNGDTTSLKNRALEAWRNYGKPQKMKERLLKKTAEILREWGVEILPVVKVDLDENAVAVEVPDVGIVWLAFEANRIEVDCPLCNADFPTYERQGRYVVPAKIEGFSLEALGSAIEAFGEHVERHKGCKGVVI